MDFDGTSGRLIVKRPGNGTGATNRTLSLHVTLYVGYFKHHTARREDSHRNSFSGIEIVVSVRVSYRFSCELCMCPDRCTRSQGSLARVTDIRVR